MSSFIKDDRGVVEPYTDLPAMALAVIGFMVFIALVAQAYSTYQQKAFIAEHYQDASNLAFKLSRDSALIGSSHPGIFDAARIEALKDDPGEIMEKYGAFYDFMFRLEAGSSEIVYSRIIKAPTADESRMGISSSLPVTVRLNEVEDLPGTLTVKIWRK